jgi:hypothetical protein
VDYLCLIPESDPKVRRGIETPGSKEMMKKPLDKKCRDLVLVCIASAMLTLAGCGESGGGPVGPPGAFGPNVGPKVSSPGVMPGPRHTALVGPAPTGLPTPIAPTPEPDKEKPAPESDSNKTDNPLGPATKVEQAGNIVSLASEIIAAGTNPFLSHMPKPLIAETGNVDAGQTATTEAPAPPADPLDGVKLLGIVYSPQAPIALVAVEGAESASQLVKPGDLISLGTGQEARIARITQGSIDVQLSGTQKEKRTFVIPDIVGYGANKAEPAAKPATDEESPGSSPTGAPTGLPTGSAGTPMGKPAPSARPVKGPLSNLKNLAAGLMGGAATAQGGPSAKAPNVVLTEP